MMKLAESKSSLDSGWSNTLDWQTLSSEWESSGLKQKKFCELKQINYQAFVYYRGKILTKNKPPKSSKKIKFSPVRIKTTSPMTTTNVLTLHLPNNITITIPPDCNTEQLKQILFLLGIKP